MTAVGGVAAPADRRPAADRAAGAVEEARDRGEEPDLDARWARLGPDATPAELAALIKADLRARYAQGRRPAVSEYLDRFPELRDLRDRVVSLVYEEYCLREERGEAPDPDEFCGRYEPWRDSLASQLRFHRLLSQVAGASPPRPRFPGPGDRFQRFRLRSVLGRGGDAQVYLALEEELGDRPVALKVSADRGGEPSILGRLDHPHIVPVLSVTHEEGTGLRGLCMPYRPGRPLHDVIRRADPASHPRGARALWKAAAPDDEPEDRDRDRPGWAGFPRDGTYVEGAAWVVMTLARALAHAHGRGVLHRDVKPANILLTARDGPQLLDFNLAHDPDATADRACAARNGGTLPYMAPEQLGAFLDPDRLGDVGPAADLYALGLVLVELLTGRRPEGPDPGLPLPRAMAELRDRRLEAPPPSARASNPSVPHALDAIASRCLAPRPSDRYASASDLAADLGRFLDRRPALRAPNPSRPERLRNWAHRNRSWLASALVLASMGSAGSLIPWRSRADLLRERAEAAPASAAPHVDYGLALEDANKPAEARRQFAIADGLPGALDAYARARAMHPQSTSAREGLGLAFLKNRRFEDARVAFEAARRLAPQSTAATVGLGLVLEEIGRPEEAQGYYDRARSRPDAEIAFARAAAIGERAARLLATHGQILLDEGRLDEAAAELKASVKRDPNLVAPRYALASIADRSQDWEEAFRHFDEALKIVEARPPGIKADKFARLYHDWACSAIKWANRLRNPGRATAADYRSSGRLYQRVLTVLKTMGHPRSGQEDFVRDRPQIHLLMAKAEIGLGASLAKTSDDCRKSLSHYRAARGLVDQLLAINPTAPEAQALDEELRRSLKLPREESSLR